MKTKKCNQTFEFADSMGISCKTFIVEHPN